MKDFSEYKTSFFYPKSIDFVSFLFLFAFGIEMDTYHANICISVLWNNLFIALVFIDVMHAMMIGYYKILKCPCLWPFPMIALL